MKIKSPFLIKILAYSFCWAMRLLFLTLRKQVIEETPGTNPYSKSTTKSFFYSVWHDSIIIPTFGGKHLRSAALTSQHTDGSVVAQTLNFVGMSAVRGSTNRISSAAIRSLLEAAENKHVVITPDGPRGPRREMSKGITYLASRSGRAVVPTAYSCTRCWRIKGSWTDLVIPKPFAKIYLVVGKPVEILADLSTAQLQAQKAIIQNEMDRLNEIAESLVTKKKNSASEQIEDNISNQSQAA